MERLGMGARGRAGIGLVEDEGYGKAKDWQE